MQTQKIDIEAIGKEIWRVKEEKRRVFPCHTNRASEIGHDCIRYLVFSRTRWQDKQLHDVELQFIFDEGRVQEKAVEETLREAGFELSNQQRAAFEHPQNISGHIDGFFSHPTLIKDPIPYEIKGLSDYNWGSVNSYEDMLNSKQWYIRKYPAQLQIYLYMNEQEVGVFILKNKGTGRLKFIPVAIDYEYVERLLQKAEKINAYVKSGDIPKETTSDMKVCESCQFNHICFKDGAYSQSLAVLNDSVIAENTNRMIGLEPSAKEYADIKDVVSKAVKAIVERDYPESEKMELLIGEYVFKLSKVKGSWRMNSIRLESEKPVEAN